MLLTKGQESNYVIDFLVALKILLIIIFTFKQ